MKNISNNTLLFFYAVPGVTIFLMLVILFFTGNTNTTDSIEFIKYAYTESDDSNLFVLLSCIMIIWLSITGILKYGLINSASRSISVFIVITMLSIVSFLYIGEFIALISVPAIVYSYLYTRHYA